MLRFPFDLDPFDDVYCVTVPVSSIDAAPCLEFLDDSRGASNVYELSSDGNESLCGSAGNEPSVVGNESVDDSTRDEPSIGNEP